MKKIILMACSIVLSSCLTGNDNDHENIKVADKKIIGIWSIDYSSPILIQYKIISIQESGDYSLREQTFDKSNNEITYLREVNGKLKVETDSIKFISKQNYQYDSHFPEEYKNWNPHDEEYKVSYKIINDTLILEKWDWDIIVIDKYVKIK